MSRSSTLYELIIADVMESNARYKRQRNQPDYRTLEQGLHPKRRRTNKKRNYRRDRVIRKLCNIQVRHIMQKVVK